jgi:hypothetical protein
MSGRTVGGGHLRCGPPHEVAARQPAARGARAEIAVCVAARSYAIGVGQERDIPAAKALLTIEVSTSTQETPL